MAYRLILSFLCLFLSFTAAKAVTAAPQAFDIEQPDGSLLTVRLCGDEHFHFLSTTDGIPLVQTANGAYYAIAEGNRLIPSATLAHNPGQRTDAEAEYYAARTATLAQVSCIYDSALCQSRSDEQDARGISQELLGGEKKGLIILVNFADLAMRPENDREAYMLMANQPGYSLNGHIGSIHDYFYDQSYGQFSLTFDVAGPVTLSKDMAYYGDNDINGNDSHPHEMIIEACDLVDDYINFRDYDWDGDGTVEQIFVIYAGYGESAGAPANTIWPHKSALYNFNPIYHDGVMVYTYACSCELAHKSGDTRNGIGVFCHEFSHCLGLPDLYDVDYSGGIGMQYWDIMNSGSYSGPKGIGEVPYGYSAFERYLCGWLDLTEITESEEIAPFGSLDVEPTAYLIRNDGSSDEFFIMENHQTGGWYTYVDTYASLHGLLVTHIYYNEAAWKNNKVNISAKRQRMTFIPADNDAADPIGDLFPGPGNVTALTGSSHSSTGAQLYNKNTDGSLQMGIFLNNITEHHDGAISFHAVKKLDITTPMMVSATDCGPAGFTLSWMQIGNPDTNTILVTSIVSSSPLEIREKTYEVHGTNMCRIEPFGGSSYICRVKASRFGLDSQWSKNLTVTLDLDSSPHAITDGTGNQAIYTLDGREASDGQRGIMIMATPKGATKIIRR